MSNFLIDIKYVELTQYWSNYDEIIIKSTNHTINILNYSLISPLSPLKICQTPYYGLNTLNWPNMGQISMKSSLKPLITVLKKFSN